jgi:hypothetical protein
MFLANLYKSKTKPYLNFLGQIYRPELFAMEHEYGKSKKRTVNLFIDDSTLKILRNEAKARGTSLNSRINAILTKYVQFYKRAEEVDDTCVIPKKYFQFVVDNITEEDNIKQVAEMHRIWVPAFLHDLNVPLTIENFIEYAARQVGINSRTIDNITYHPDSDTRNLILVFTHRFGLKWSRVLSSGLSIFIEDIFRCRTKLSVYPGSFVIRVLDYRPNL